MKDKKGKERKEEEWEEGVGGGGRCQRQEEGQPPHRAGAGASSRLTPAFELSLRLLQGPCLASSAD